jgi:hypothetical protein
MISVDINILEVEKKEKQVRRKSAEEMASVVSGTSFTEFQVTNTPFILRHCVRNTSPFILRVLSDACG